MGAGVWPLFPQALCPPTLTPDNPTWRRLPGIGTKYSHKPDSFQRRGGDTFLTPWPAHGSVRPESGSEGGAFSEPRGAGIARGRHGIGAPALWAWPARHPTPLETPSWPGASPVSREGPCGEGAACGTRLLQGEDGAAARGRGGPGRRHGGPPQREGPFQGAPGLRPGCRGCRVQCSDVLDEHSCWESRKFGLLLI